MYLDCFSDQEDVFTQFRPTDEEKAFVKHIVFAEYTQEMYEGSAQVVFIGNDDKLYEVNGSHCSYYGLEDQWEPEETSLEYFIARKERGADVSDNLLRALAEGTFLITRGIMS